MTRRRNERRIHHAQTARMTSANVATRNVNSIRKPLPAAAQVQLREIIARSTRVTAATTSVTTIGRISVSGVVGSAAYREKSAPRAKRNG